jgi:hypothetical protein
MTEIPILSIKQVGDLEWESPILDMSFMDDYPAEVDAILEAQRDDTIRRVVELIKADKYFSDEVEDADSLPSKPPRILVSFSLKTWQELERMVK